MPRDKSVSHARIIKAAKKEFLDKGFEKASMRGIGREANMTQAALYRHFKSKEDMFLSLVDPAIQAIEQNIDSFEKSIQNKIDEERSLPVIFENPNVQTAKDFLCQYRDEFRLIICCSGGTKYENYIHDLVRKLQKIIYNAFETLTKKGKKMKDITEEELHVIISAYITAVFEPVVHDWPLEDCLHELDLVEEFFLPGWYNLLGF